MKNKIQLTASVKYVTPGGRHHTINFETGKHDSISAVDKDFKWMFRQSINSRNASKILDKQYHIVEDYSDEYGSNPLYRV